ncbi:hypothetical protein HFZ78_13540 [Priestia megaterium]|uniref:Uncharacterized protein n=1 Tax=Priestia megaterium TaxID=1404 RepID=A0A6H1P2X4_PRIMG|nr:hypothetical protein [Priestia megaterium]QIZ07631.1 hypothetical protein HFZ78_13540 [Priestia megaterium]
MMIEFKLIQLAEQIGCEMRPEGENIRVMNIDSLPSLLKVKIIEHKTQILEILKRDNQAKKMGFIIGLPGQIYFRSINKKSIVYMEEYDGNWELWMETHHANRSTSIKVIYRSSEFEKVILKAKNYFDFVQQKQNNRNLQ